MPDLFPLFWDGSSEFVETYRYKTSVFVARSRVEQRRRQRVHPVGSFEYSFVGFPGHSQQLAQQLLANLQGREWLVPWWPYATRLTEAVAAGATTMPYTDDAVPLYSPTGVWRPLAFWKDADTWKSCPCTAAAAGSSRSSTRS